MFNAKDAARVRGKITAALSANASISPAQALGIIPAKNLQGKLFEAYVLSRIIEDLVKKENCDIRLVSSSAKLKLKQKGSIINRSFPYFEVFRDNCLFGELFTDTYFTGVSYERRNGSSPQSGDYHELDIVLIQPGQNDWPTYKAIMMAVECKATTIEKSTFREVLGFRRELGLLTDKPKNTCFRTWPAAKLPVGPEPASVQLLYTTDLSARKYEKNALEFGIEVKIEKM